MMRLSATGTKGIDRSLRYWARSSPRLHGPASLNGSPTQLWTWLTRKSVSLLEAAADRSNNSLFRKIPLRKIGHTHRGGSIEPIASSRTSNFRVLRVLATRSWPGGTGTVSCADPIVGPRHSRGFSDRQDLDSRRDQPGNHSDEHMGSSDGGGYR
jgi:hypothetical protein